MVLILDGKKVQHEAQIRLKQVIREKKEQGFNKPCLAIIQIGNNKESEFYIVNKKKFAESISAHVLHIHLPEQISEEEVLKEINNVNSDDSVHGIILQLPLPKQLNKELLLESIDSTKDVDGLHSVNIKGLWVNSKNSIMPATTRGIISILEYYKIPIEGKNVVVIGRSTLVGKPTAIALLNKNATVTICHSGTVNIEYITLEADIIISAVGRPRFITESHVKPHQTIIDVGTTVEEISTKKLVGDVNFEEVSKIVGAISPVPGGVGPMTVTSLFENLIDAYLRKLMI
jgi:methylenetetrahydrofolate dehydrogenase (NADP+)/methenyltetrahydrofolate cyclohydrolase